jgi:class 3 adenylate cyclase
MASEEGRGRRAAVDVAIVMVSVALVSLLVVAVFNYFAARALLNGAVEAQLRDVASSRGTRIEDGSDSLAEYAETLASDESVVRALTDLSQGFAATTGTLAPTQTEALRSAYEAGVASLVPEGVDVPPVEGLLPTTETGRYLQYHYIAQNDAEDRSALVDAGDGSAYTTAHARHHPTLRTLAEGLRMGDLLLIDADTGSVVYTVEKRADFATGLADGPYADSALAEAVLERLQTVGADEAVFVDFQPYVPAGGDALLFVASAVRDEGRVVGAVAIEVPNELFTEVLTGSGEWSASGLGETGEIYVVGADGLLRSESRPWLEDPDAYLDALDEAGYDDEIAAQILAYESTVLAQPVDNEAVESALAGDDFDGVAEDYLSRSSLTVASPIEAGGMEWVLVASMTTDEAYGPLRRYALVLLVLALVFAPAVALLAAWISRKLLGQIGPIEEASHQVSGGSLDVRLPDFGRDEFGDIAAKFNAVVDTLRRQEEELVEAEADTTEMLMAVMPSELAEQVREGGRDVAQAVRNATLIAIRVEEPSGGDPMEQEAIADHSVAFAERITELAEAHGARVLRSSATEQLYGTGLAVEGSPEPETPTREAELQAVAFAEAVRDRVAEMAVAAGLTLEFRAGIASGDVVAGVVGTGRIAFTVWGRPRRSAAELVSVARPDQILVDPDVAGEIGAEWLIEPVADLVDLKGEPLDGWRIVGRRARD